ncbi:MAG: hypothetical protein LPL00_06415 [Alphaproteobacteria bacterium]|nr:hypothetical protein [Alphaproteobacteria bacterium]MDX5369181.1 hypothetical protein [Alphaproteobacteria bacterium]MDX5463877.1 hypothetical protein [Alphaproteobacteria bacterium]
MSCRFAFSTPAGAARLLAAAFALASLLMLAGTARAQDDAALVGVFVGVDTADGAGLLIERAAEGGYRGRFLSPDQVLYEISGNIENGVLRLRAVAETKMAYLRIQPVSVGLVMAMIPVEGTVPPDETPAPSQLGRAVQYAFVREGTKLPNLPGRIRPAPDANTRYLSTLTFLDNYPYWPADGVVRGFALIPANHVAMIRMFPRVQADLFWKMCDAGGLNPQLKREVDAAGTSCEEVRTAFAGFQAKGTFDDFKADVEADTVTLRDAIACGQGMKARQRCQAISQILAEAALNAPSVGKILQEYR